ncbi:lambda exonuclease family protein [Frigoribacterium sp. RIT-PI-h]|uniref:lambda exonuclease family protein n=1 Tax=Frigoribacterium sp. RIT-PI-h TaxID=1690245 RepID=UPI0006B91E9F|nr:lambda exonuclease family protein [Frigoribacterium sp. RIT-PI-h]KPG86495.1 hypothetical protein AEQ27_04050 [Frigoribacterium sp. RIT-PI-h]
MTLTIYETLEQGSDEWLAARCGLVTASTVGQLITAKTFKPANNDTARALTMHLVAERITGYVEPTFVSPDMERGNWDEPIARDLYSEHYAKAVEVGFMTNTFEGHTLGYSPDGLVGSDGLIEIKSRRQKKQLATILADEVPAENIAQVQAGLMVSGRAWLDYVSFCAGMPLYRKRVFPDPRWQVVIIDALTQFEETAAQMIDTFHDRTKNAPKTERVPDIAGIEF